MRARVAPATSARQPHSRISKINLLPVPQTVLSYHLAQKTGAGHRSEPTMTRFCRAVPGRRLHEHDKCGSLRREL